METKKNLHTLSSVSRAREKSLPSDQTNLHFNLSDDAVEEERKMKRSKGS